VISYSFMYSEHTAAIAAPPNRRKRPALSCLQCRRRKVKCDQKKPCSQCQRSKGVVCAYGSEFSTPSHHFENQHQRQRETTLRGIVAEQHIGSQEEIGILTPSTSISTLSIDNTQSTESPVPPQLCPQAKIGELLSALNNSISKSQNPDHDGDRLIRGTPFKLKFFGESHWMNDLLHVSLSPLSYIR
jgi:hypothetical protein